MSLSATVMDITTCTKSLPNKPQVDIVMLNYNGLAYCVEVPVGQLRQNQTVAVEVISPGHDGVPLSIQLAR